MGIKEGSLILPHRVCSFKKKNGENVSDFNKIFNKIYNKIPWDINHSQEATKFTYASARDSEFVVILKERRPATLLSMQDDYLDVEGNMTTSGKLKHRQ